MRFIHKHEIPVDRLKDVTYIKFVCTVRTEKKDPTINICSRSFIISQIKNAFVEKHWLDRVQRTRATSRILAWVNATLSPQLVGSASSDHSTSASLSHSAEI